MKTDLPTWWIYIIQADDDRLYTGITTEMARRWHQHLGGRGGARFFRGRKPKCLCYLEPGESRSQASQREIAIKQLSRQQKLELIESRLTRSKSHAELCQVELLGFVCH